MTPESLSPEEFQQRLAASPALLAYFSAPGCNVCVSLQPKIWELLEAEFPRMDKVYVDTSSSRELAAQQQVFAVPTLIGYFDGREFIRKGRSMGLGELRGELVRPYGLLFD